MPWYADIVSGDKALKPVGDINNLGLKVSRILHFLFHRRPTPQIWHHGDPSLPPSWSMLFSREQKCSGHTSTLIFFWGGGGGMGKYLEWTGFTGKYSKIRHTTCIFLNIFVQDWRLAQWWEHSLHTDVAWVWISEITPFLVWFYVLPRGNIFQFQFDGQFQTKNAYVVDALALNLFVCLFIYLILISFLPAPPFILTSVRPSSHHSLIR